MAVKMAKEEAERKRKQYEQYRRDINPSYSCSLSDWMLANSVSITSDSSYSDSSSCDNSSSHSSSDYSSSSSSYDSCSSSDSSCSSDSY